MRRLKTILFPQHDNFEPWCSDVMELVGVRHDIAVFDENESIERQFEGVEVVVDHGGRSATREMMDAATDASLWQILGTGFDRFDLDHIKSKGIAAANTPGQFSSIALAETAMMLILMLAREYRQSYESVQTGVFGKPLGRELVGATLGVIGFGASGQELARRAKPFGMRIMGIDVVKIDPDKLADIEPEFMGSPDDMDQVIEASDYVSLHLHLNDETRHVINACRIGKMKPTACLINVARGALVDEDALSEALIDQRIGGAGLDVFAREPVDPTLPAFQLPNVVITPHIAGVTYETSRRRAMCVVENVDRIAEGFEPNYRIDT